MDSEIIRRMLLDLTPFMESINASIENMNTTIKTAPIVNSIENMDLNSIESAQNSMIAVKGMIKNSMEDMNRGSMQSSIGEMANLNDIIGASVDRLSIVNQIDIDDFSSQISYLLSNIDLDLFKDRFYNLERLEPNLNQVLNKYQWFVTSEMPMPFISELMNLSKMDKPRSKINKLFFDYFTYNNFENLKELVEKWESGGKFRPGRLKIIKDCSSSIINSKNGKIPSTLIVPTLIAQIDGIQREILLKNNFKRSRTLFKDEDTGKKMDQNGAWKHRYEPDDVFSSIINDIILDVLFANAMPGEPIKTPITFSRHKIMHGEHLNYGTKPNTIRTFLILDFLHDLRFKEVVK